MKRKNKGAGDAFAQSGRAALAHLDACYHAAKRGDRDAAKWLLGFAHRSTRDLECLLRVNPELMQGVLRENYGRELPVLRSWSNTRNKDRDDLVKKFNLGGSLPLKAERDRDEFFFRLVEELIPSMGFFRMNFDRRNLPDLIANQRICRKWANAIANDQYPRGKPQDMPNCPADKLTEREVPVFANSVDWKFVLPYLKGALKRRQGRLKTKDRPQDLAVEWRQDAQSAKASRATYGDFRTGFLELVTARLKAGARETPWNFRAFGKRMRKSDTR